MTDSHIPTATDPLATANARLRQDLDLGRDALVLQPDGPTLAGLDGDDPEARGAGVQGLPLAHLGDMRRLLDGVNPLRCTVMIEADSTAPWLLALLVAATRAEGADPASLRGHVRNDLFRAARLGGTTIWPPQAALGIATDLVAWTCGNLPGWGPMTLSAPTSDRTAPRDLGFALAALVAVLDDLRAKVRKEDFPAMADRIALAPAGGDEADRTLAALRATILAARYGIAPAAAQAPDTAPAGEARAEFDRLMLNGGALGALTRAPAPSVATAGALAPDRSAELSRWRLGRDNNAVQKSLVALREAAKRRINILGPSVACARAGVTTGEWAGTLRGVFGSATPQSTPLAAE